ncbi:MAG: hypothetical protein RL748_599 [Pseudomonadota bacterium]
MTQGWQRRYTPVGKFMQAGLFTSALLGVNTRQALAYQIFGLLLALLVLARLYVALGRRQFSRGVHIERHLPRYATVGQPFTYQISIRYPGGSLPPGLSVFEMEHDPRPGFEQFLRAREPGAQQRNAFDRYVGYYRWAWLVRMNRVARSEEVLLPALPSGSDTLLLRAQCVPHARGVWNLDGIALAQRDPLGLCRNYQMLDLPAQVLVLPRTYALPPRSLPGQLHNQPEHQASAARGTDHEEIVGLRPYRAGDALRDIHWKAFARLGEPVVREYQNEYFERHALLLDTCGVAASEAFEEAVALAASLVGNVDAGSAWLDLLFIGESCHCFTMGPGQLQAEALMRVLANVRPEPGQALDAMLANVVSRRDELCSCICILLSWDTARQQMLQQLQQLGLPLLVWLVAEQSPPDCPPWVQVLVPGRIVQSLGAA